MTIQQYAKLLQYIQQNNSWGILMHDVTIVRNRKAIKYVDASFDSRDGKIWRVEFRSVTGEEDKAFRVDSQKDIDEIYKWLDEPLRKEG